MGVRAAVIPWLSPRPVPLFIIRRRRKASDNNWISVEAAV